LVSPSPPFFFQAAAAFAAPDALAAPWLVGRGVDAPTSVALGAALAKRLASGRAGQDGNKDFDALPTCARWGLERLTLEVYVRTNCTTCLCVLGVFSKPVERINEREEK
jgi:hypothetical protein